MHDTGDYSISDLAELFSVSPRRCTGPSAGRRPPHSAEETPPLIAEGHTRPTRACAVTPSDFSTLERLLAAPNQKGEDRHRECGPPDVERPGTGPGLISVSLKVPQR